MKKILYFIYNRMANKITVLIMMCGGMAACSDFIEIDAPKTEIVNETVFVNDASAISAVRGIYSLMMTNTSFTKAGIEEYTGIAADEFINYATRADQIQFFQNSLTPKNTDVLGIFWREAYRYINNANAILEGLAQPNGLTLATRKQLEGEAKFIRAYCYFYLVNLFGEVPYLFSTDYRVNAVAPRNSIPIVYSKIEEDLLEATMLLVSDFSFANEERIQPNKGAAQALLARLYLYTGEWLKAETFSSLLIDNTLQYGLETDLDKVFLANSMEAIWQLKPVVPGINTPQGQYFILTGTPNASSRRVSLRPELINAFEMDDKRKDNWIGVFSNASGAWYYPYKYKVGFNSTLTEYSMIFRLAEQYLIRAEARAHLNKLEDSKSDLNSIRARAGLGTTGASDQAELLLAIEQERNVELFTENGHRWMDLKRTGRADIILTPLKTDWQSTDIYFPIPESEMLLNPNLTQNPGY